MLEIVIPMAGSGSRFRERGYEIPKPLLPVAGRAMIARVMENVIPTQPSRLHLVHDARTVPAATLREAVRGARGRIELVALDGKTEGAAVTVLEGLRHADPANPLLIANSDQLVEFSVDDFLGSCRGFDGGILTFTAHDERWSFAKTVGGRVEHVEEKKVISDEATVGIYYFASVALFREAAEAMIRKNVRTNGEFYVAPVYNEIVGRGRVVTYRLDDHGGRMHGLGTPDDYEKFLAADPFDWSPS